MKDLAWDPYIALWPNFSYWHLLVHAHVWMHSNDIIYRMPHKSVLIENITVCWRQKNTNGQYKWEEECSGKGRNCPFACFWPLQRTDSWKISLSLSQQTTTWKNSIGQIYSRFQELGSVSHEEQVAQEIQLTMKAVWLYLPRLQ